MSKYERALNHKFKDLSTCMHSYASLLYRIVTDKNQRCKYQLYTPTDNLLQLIIDVEVLFSPSTSLKYIKKISRYIKNTVLNFQAADFAFEEAFKKGLVACYEDVFGDKRKTGEFYKHEAIKREITEIARLILKYNESVDKKFLLFDNDLDFLDQLQDLKPKHIYSESPLQTVAAQ